jgi:pimeloyl-ACP methyl ester carboxylesterase
VWRSKKFGHLKQKKRMIAWILVLLFLVLAVCFVTFSGYPSDVHQPLNYILFQEPRNRYSNQLVNLWVAKPGDPVNRIPCTLEQASGFSLENRKLLIYSHGNGEHLGSCQPLVNYLAQHLSFDVLAYDYSGYGLNKFDSNERTAAGVNQTLRAVFDEALKLGYKSQNVTLLGYSLGSGPSTALAASLANEDRELGGLVLLAAYASIKDVIADKSHKSIAAIFSERWNNVDVIRLVKCPVLIVHGVNDSLIKFDHALRLHEASPGSTLVTLPATGHCDFQWVDLVEAISKWEANLE